MADSIHIVTTEVCGRCKFSEATGSARGLLSCKRFPPHGTAVPVGNDANNQPVFMTHSYYPAVEEHEKGCGEWKPRIALTN